MDSVRKIMKVLGRRKETLGTAESCTGGLLGHILTSVPGVSKIYQGGTITYANSAKSSLLKVRKSLIEKHGAVSQPVALAMAQGAKKLFKSNWGIGITGIAGPSGGSARKPVGLVYISIVGPHVEEVACCHFKGSRQKIQKAACSQALKLLLQNLE